MRILRSMAMAFATYSRLPVPRAEWREEDMRYMLWFFPWVGAFLGGCVYLWSLLCEKLGLGSVCRALISAALPILVTGGFHADGFLDVSDAFGSLRPREAKLEILRDSHIGAFAVIRFAAYGLVWLAAFSEIRGRQNWGIVCAGFALSRCLSGIAAIALPRAKPEGTLNDVASGAAKGTGAVLALQGALCAAFMCFLSPVGGAAASAAALLAWGVGSLRCRRELGGITGDAAGYLLLWCEESIAAAAAFMSILGGSQIGG